MIGVFDSGIGGLTALGELMQLLPHEDFLYFADEAHRPFGALPRIDVCRHTAAALRFFEEQGCDRVLLACGTASALAMEFCKQNFTFPLYGVIEPTAEEAAVCSRNRRIAVAATEATVKSGAYERALRRTCPDAQLFPIACAPLVALAERGADGEECYRAVATALSPLRAQKPDTLILGCTHFSLLSRAIHTFLPHTALIDSGKAGARRLAEEYQAPPRGPRRGGRLRVYTTQNSQEFTERIRAILNKRILPSTL